MSFLYGGARPASQDSLRDYQRKIASAARGMEREIRRQDAQEKALERELSRCARDNNIEVATSKARELVRLRAHRGRLYTMKEHMTGLSQQLMSVQSSSRIQETLANTARMLHSLNARFDAPSVARMLADFERQNALITSKQEIVDDTLDSAFEADGEADATSEAVLSVLQGVGLDLRGRFGSAGKGASSELEGGEEDLEARLQRLRPD
jgi:charged multivesicular body protein 2A